MISFLARHRSGGLTDASLVGSIIAGGVVLPIVAGVALVVAAVARHWRLAGFLLLALAVESGSYRATTLVIHRHRPEVFRLERLPVDASYPSGHTAASIAIYGGIALLIASRIENRAGRIAVWTAAALVVVFVAFARMYRGMHHPLDIAGGVLVGVAALCALVLVSRATHLAARAGGRMTKVAVIAHAGKSFGDGLPELRRELARQGVDDPLWIEVPKSRFVSKQVKRVLSEGSELLFAWGGDGTVQRCVDELAGTETPLAILPAGTANLLATNLGIPQDIERAVAIGLHGERRKLDVGQFEGEHFAVMAGIGFDAAMIQQADGTLKDRFGRAAYVWTGSKNLRAKPFKAKIKVDGVPWYVGDASCILVGNVGRLFGGIEVFEDARPDDGQLDVGVVNAEGVVDWIRTLARTAAGHPERSPLVQATKASKISVKLNRKVLYEVDGGDRVEIKAFKIRVQPAAITICRPTDDTGVDRDQLDVSGAGLVLGPLLRYAGTESATFWVETDAACEVEILGQRTATFAVEGHHYALLLVDDLEPASVVSYDVRLDGELVWPPDDGRPRPVSPYAQRGAASTARVRLVPCRRSAADRPRRRPGPTS